MEKDDLSEIEAIIGDWSEEEEWADCNERFEEEQDQPTPTLKASPSNGGNKNILDTRQIENDCPEESGYEIVSTNKGKPKLLLNGYSYHLNKKVEEIYYWSCVKKRDVNKDFRCKATIKSECIINRHVLEVPTGHSHPPNVLVNHCAKYKESLKRRSNELGDVPTLIIKECAKAAPSEVQTMISKSAQKKICLRSRKEPEAHPKPPVSEEEFDAMEDRFTKTIDGAPFLLGKQNTANGVILMFSTADNISRLAASKTWMLDGTFATAPQGFRQIYSILASVGTGDSMRFLPLVFFFLPSKSEDTYMQAFQLLIKAAEEMDHELDPDVTLTDFEKAAIKAINNLFPDSRVQGCFFHLVQNFYKRIQSNGLVPQYAKNKDVYMAFKKTEALAFLPPEKVADGFQQLKNSAPDSMDSFFQYVEDSYVLGCTRKIRKDGTKARSKPCFEIELWNVHESVLSDRPRTTNRLEGWHNRWRVLNEKSSGFYETISNLQKEQKVTEGEIMKILQGIPCVKRNAKEVEKDKQLKEVVMKFENYKSLNDYLLGIALVLKDN